jgi:hypothetical protein
MHMDGDTQLNCRPLAQSNLKEATSGKNRARMALGVHNVVLNVCGWLPHEARRHVGPGTGPPENTFMYHARRNIKAKDITSFLKNNACAIG